MSRLGFTLIELLVVVLIIGILAAVAVPQYQKAVEKSRAMEGVILTRAILNAQQRYFLENGTYTKDLNDLDIQIPGTEVTPSGDALSVQSAKYFKCAAASTGTDTSLIAFCLRKAKNAEEKYFLFAQKDGVIKCGWGSGSPQGAKWCKLLTGQEGNEKPIKF